MPPPAVMGERVLLDPDRLARELADARKVRDHLDRVVAWLESGLDLFVDGEDLMVADTPAELLPPGGPGPTEPAPASGPRPDDDAARPAPRPTPAAVAPAGTGGEPVDQAVGSGGRGANLSGLSAAKAADSLERIRGAFDRLGPGWLTTASVAAEAGLGPGTVSSRLKELVAAGELEHNGKGGAHKRHRVTPAEQEAAPPAPPGVSRRVARELERERLETATAAGRQNGTDPREGTLEGRIMQVLIGGNACGVRELAKRLGMTVPSEPLVSTVSVLASHGDVRIYPNPRRAEIGQETKLIEACA